MALRFQFCGRLFDILDVKLKPGLRRGKFSGPGILTKTGLRCLCKRPQSESLGAFQRLSMKIAAIFFFEADAQDLVVQFATCIRLTDDWTKACDEQHLD